ncbi:hypothetical protein JCM3765_005391 [Sporobolomyces pararoseus]
MDQAGSYSIANFQGPTNPQLNSSSAFSSRPLPLTQTTTQAVPPLKSLPAPIALLTVAQSLRSSALALLPSLSKPPQSQNSHLRYAKAWSDYYRLTTASIVVLRSAINCASTGEFRGGRIELRANAMLAEQLADVYEGTEHAETVVEEAEAALTRAQAIAQSHPSLSPFIPSLTLLQVRLALFSTKRVKYARTLLKKLLSSPLLSTTMPSSLAALYGTHSTLATLPSISYAERMTAWQTVANVAQQNGDIQVQVLAVLARSRLSLEVDDCETTKSCLKQIQQYLGPSTDAAKSDPSAQVQPEFATAIKVEFRLIASLLAAQLGEVKEAKDLLKTTHALLDSADASTASFSDGTIRITGPNAANARFPAPLYFRLPSHSALYSFTYLASVAVHRDPYGKAPRSALFVDEGIRVANTRLEGKEALLPMTRISSAAATLTSTARLKVHLHLFACELAIMRNSPSEASQHLLAAVTTSRKPSAPREGNAVWEEFKDRLILDLGLIHLVKEEEEEAEKCFEAVIVSAGSTAKSNKTKPVESSGTTILQLAELSLLLLKLSQGHSIPLSSSSIASSPAMSRSTSHPSLSSSIRRQSTSNPTSARLESLSRSILSLDESIPSPTPSLEFIISLTKALTCGEIVKSKSNLSNALNLTGKLSANHARALTLALLANLFEQTRNTEALKMLNSSQRLVQGMGGKPVKLASTGSQQLDKEEYLVGNARLGLWLGERLLASLRAVEKSGSEKVEKQKKLNEAHRVVLNSRQKEKRKFGME